MFGGDSGGTKITEFARAPTCLATSTIDGVCPLSFGNLLSSQSVPVVTARYVLQGDESPTISQRDRKLTCICLSPASTADERFKVFMAILVRWDCTNNESP